MKKEPVNEASPLFRMQKSIM
ncbi:Protein of unknown function [Bacillus wiedmannii]|nr:Protein of unknown function [Bacillus wiedmannii]